MLVWFSNGYFAIPKNEFWILINDEHVPLNPLHLWFVRLRTFSFCCFSIWRISERKFIAVLWNSPWKRGEKNVANIFHISFLANINIFWRIPFHRAFWRRRKANSKISRKITINCSSLFSTCANSRFSLAFLFCSDNKPKKTRNWSGGNPGGFRNDVNWIMEVLSYRRSDFHVCDVLWLFF